MGERLRGPDELVVRGVRLVDAHWVLAVVMGAATPEDRGAEFLLATRRGALVGKGYFRSIDELAEVVDLAHLRPDE